MSRPSGSTVRLRCRALGRPRPQVTWLKDGQMMTDVTSEDEHRFTLKLVDVEDEDAGEYTCKVYNRAGEIYYTYDLKVTGESNLLPIGCVKINTNVMISKNTHVWQLKLKLRNFFGDALYYLKLNELMQRSRKLKYLDIKWVLISVLIFKVTGLVFVKI